MTDKGTVCVYGASSTDIKQEYFQAAYQTGRLLALEGMRVVNGGGRMGLMGATTEGALRNGGRVVGVIPEFMVRKDLHHKQLTELVVTPDMHKRKQTMAEMSDAAIALPGGCGTLEELLEIITWRQLSLFSGPVVILNTDDYYRPLSDMLARAVEQHFMKPELTAAWKVADTPEEAVTYIKEHIGEEIVFTKI